MNIIFKIWFVYYKKKYHIRKTNTNEVSQNITLNSNLMFFSFNYDSHRQLLAQLPSQKKKHSIKSNQLIQYIKKHARNHLTLRWNPPMLAWSWAISASSSTQKVPKLIWIHADGIFLLTISGDPIFMLHIQHSARPLPHTHTPETLFLSITNIPKAREAKLIRLPVSTLREASTPILLILVRAPQRQDRHVHT